MAFQPVKKLYEDVWKFKESSRKLLKDITFRQHTEDTIASEYCNVILNHTQWLFNVIARLVWLDHQILVKGERFSPTKYTHLSRHTYHAGVWKKYIAGIDSAVISVSRPNAIMASYIQDFLPEFLLHDPITEPEYFQFPFKHINMSHLWLVYQIPERMEILQYAEENKMPYPEFINMVANYVLSQNDDSGQNKYEFTCYRNDSPNYIKNIERTKMSKRQLSKPKYNFIWPEDLKKKHGK